MKVFRGKLGGGGNDPDILRSGEVIIHPSHVPISVEQLAKQLQGGEMSGRGDVTAMLSGLVEKRLSSRRMFWAPEVSFDKGTPKERRIDYVGFKPFTPNYVTEPASVELGTFECYEVKSCMADFQSGHGLTFYGDRNYLVTTREFAEELRLKMLMPRGVNAILVPNKTHTALLALGGEEHGYSYGSQSYRRRVASEMLWQIMRARHHYDIKEEA